MYSGLAPVYIMDVSPEECAWFRFRNTEYFFLMPNMCFFLSSQNDRPDVYVQFSSIFLCKCNIKIKLKIVFKNPIKLRTVLPEKAAWDRHIFCSPEI